MTSPEEPLERAAAAFSRARTVAELRAAIDAWAPSFHQALPKRMDSREYPALGMELSRIPGRGGLTARRGESFFVGVGKKGDHARRFTLAHEFAHILLIRSQETRPLTLSPEDEETLCDRFAQRALAPPALVREDIARYGAPLRISDVEGFARRFRISLRASLVVLQEFIPARWSVAFVAVTWRGHPKRPEVLGLRVDASAADRRLFVPRDARLATLGLEALEATIAAAELGSECSGGDSRVEVRSNEMGVSSWTAESVPWEAKVLTASAPAVAADQRAALCQLDVSRLVPAPRRPRRPSAPRRAPVHRAAREIPGQTLLTDLTAQ